MTNGFFAIAPVVFFALAGIVSCAMLGWLLHDMLSMLDLDRSRASRGSGATMPFETRGYRAPTSRLNPMPAPA